MPEFPLQQPQPPTLIQCHLRDAVKALLELGAEAPHSDGVLCSMSSVHLGLNGWSDPLPASDPIHHQALISWHLVIWTYTLWISYPKLIINLSWPARYCGHPYTLQPLYLVILLVKGWTLFYLQSCVFLKQLVERVESYCSSVGWSSMMRISCSTTSQSCSTGLRSSLSGEFSVNLGDQQGLTY